MWISIVFTLFIIRYVFSETCPPREDIMPCFCSTPGSEINILCSHLVSLKQLNDSMKGFTNHKIFSFAIKSSTFEYIPYDLFENVTIKQLEISQSNFSIIGKLGYPQFKGLESSLETLIFRKSFTQGNPLSYVSMENLNRLTSLEVYDSYVGHINNIWFKQGPKNLKVLRFVKCDIRIIGHHAFNSLTNLKVIDLSDNELTYIPRWAFPEPATYLEELNLERNKFETLAADIFTEMHNLKIVNLELNEFSTIDEIIWGSVWNQLELINIDYSPLVCDQKIKWIYKTRDNLEKKLIATCYKPFSIMERDLHSLKLEELGKTGL